MDCSSAMTHWPKSLHESAHSTNPPVVPSANEITYLTTEDSEPSAFPHMHILSLHLVFFPLFVLLQN